MENRKTGTPIAQRIKANYSSVLNEPSIETAFKKLDGAQLQEIVLKVREALTTHLNFESYKHSLQSVKTRLGRLSTETEQLFLSRCEQAVNGYRAFVKTLDHSAEMFSATG